MDNSVVHNLDPRLVIQVLQFLWSLYSGRRSGSKPGAEGKEGGPAASGQIPNPEKLEELIKDVEKTPSQTQESISAAIDEKFSPGEAHQVKADFAAFAALANPPEFADYDFSGLIQNYVKQMQAIALRADLFRLRGEKSNRGTRLLRMPDTAGALLPRSKAHSAVYTVGEIVEARVADYGAVLTDAQQNPLLVVISGEFVYPSYGYDTQRIRRGEQVYRFGPGQENNWLQFNLASRDYSYDFLPFGEFEYRLGASDVKAVFAALKKDIVSYLSEVEEERPLLNELRRELNGLSTVTASKPT